MTHDTRFSVPLHDRPGILRTAVVYDFIPLDWPGYLPTVASRMAYVAKLARLRDFDLLFPISEYSASRLSQLTGVSRNRIHVTGASVRHSLYEVRDRLASASSAYDRNEPYFVTLGGDDRRKNTEVAVKAVERLNRLHSRRIPLKVISFYCDAYKIDLLRLAGHSEGAGFLEFYPSIPDEQVVSLHAGAIAAIAPSKIEGFSLPVAEASICGCPVIASTCAAHLELVEDAQALFPPDDSVDLSEKLEALLNDPELRASLVASQAHLADSFHEDAVGRRFWNTVEAAIEKRDNVAAVGKRQKPRLAFLSPYPPDQSAVARYTAMTMREGEPLFDSDIYTDASRPLTFEGCYRDGGVITLAPLVAGRYNGVISVLGNSSSHSRIFKIFERYGGPCILHDAGDLLSVFIEQIIERASPLIVHTATQQAQIKKQYGANAHVTTCCPTIFFDEEDLTAPAKRVSRERLGIAPGSFVISSFGGFAQKRATASCIFALELLRSWNVPAELYLIGNAGPEEKELNRISALYGIGEHVHCSDRLMDDATYREFLIASDAAVQLQSNGLEQSSTALLDCIGAGLSCVATSDLIKSCDAPAYVLAVPDRFSPLQVAEQLALVWEGQAGRASHRDARAAYLQTHNFERYAKRLAEILDVA